MKATFTLENTFNSSLEYAYRTPLHGDATRIGLDKILVRKDNEYWKWQVTDFNTWTLFFAKKAVGEWWIKDVAEDRVTVRWRYSYYATSIFTQPFNWLFVKLFWRVVMKRGIAFMKEMAENREPFLYE